MNQQELVTNRAMQLFGQYGIRMITMSDVAQACGMSKKTVYQLFENKDELVRTVVTQLTARYTEAYQAICGQSLSAPEEVLASVALMEAAFRDIPARLVSELYRYYPGIWQQMSGFSDAVVLGFIRSNLQRGQDQGYYHRYFDNELIAAMRLRELRSLHSSHEETTGRPQLREVLTQISFHYLAGLATQHGRQLLRSRFHHIYPTKTDTSSNR